METSSLLSVIVSVLVSIVLGGSPAVDAPPQETDAPEAPAVVEATPDPESVVEEAPCVSVWVVEPREPQELTPEPAQVQVAADQITQVGEVVSYTVVPSFTGYYSFEMGEMHVDFSPNIAIYDSLGQCLRQTNWGASNGSNIVIKLEAGKTYTFDVEQYEGTGSYELTMGAHREALDITSADVVHDRINFTGQRLDYTFTAAETGTYRFEFAEMMVDFSPNIAIVDRLGNVLRDTDWGMSNGSGVTAKLEAGETYAIQVSWYEGLGTFDMHIGKQAPTVDITGFDAVCDQIGFMEQANVYTIEVEEPGTFLLSLLNMFEGCEVNIEVTNHLGETVGETDFGRGNGEALEVDMFPGETYTIKVTWYEGTGYYELWLEQIAWG